MKITSRNGESFQGVDCESGDCNNGSLAQKKMLLAFLRAQSESGDEEGRGGDWKWGSALLDVDEPLGGSQEDEDGVDCGGICPNGCCKYQYSCSVFLAVNLKSKFISKPKSLLS